MTIKKTHLSLLLLGFMAYHPAVSASEIAPNVSLSLASKSAKPATVLANESASVGPKQAECYPAENLMEKCFSMLAYDPNDTSVNLHDQPDGNVIISLPNFTLLRADVGPAAIWPDSWNSVVVLETEQAGYVWHELLRQRYYQVQDPQDTGANFRQLPNGLVLSTLPNGTEVRFIGESGTWTQVELANGAIGYVATVLLTTDNCF